LEEEEKKKEEEVEEEKEVYLEESDSNNAMHRRMDMAKWLSDAINSSDLITRHSLLQMR
jgi:hypothetical protein